MSRTIICFSLLALFFLAGCREKFKSGDAAFAGTCSKCHKLNGKGGKKGPELTRVVDKYDEDYIFRYILDPRSIKPDGTMPPAKLTDREVELIIEYLKKVSAEAAVVSPASENSIKPEAAHAKEQ